jgi:general secretion pathway protein A
MGQLERSNRKHQMLNIYLSHYKLKEKPFQLTANPKFFWQQRKCSKAISALMYEIQNNSGLYLVTGDPGTGKTTLINYISKILEHDSIIAKVPHPDGGGLDFLNSISNLFGIKKLSSSRGAFLNQFRSFLCDANSQNKKALLIVDEAHKITGACLKELDSILNIGPNDKMIFNVILVGQRELNNLIKQPEIKMLSTKVSKKLMLKSLNEQETAGYVEHRLKVAGTTTKIFSPEAIRQIYFLSKGNPRLINSICDHALLTGYSNGIKLIDSSIIEDCADELRIVTGEKEKDADEFVEKKALPPTNLDIIEMFRIPQILVIFVLMILLTFGYLFMVKRTDTSSKSSVKQLAHENYVKIKDKIEAIEAEGSSLPSSFEVSAINDNIRKKELPPEKEDILDFASRTDYIIHFDSNSNELTKEAIEILNQIVKNISEHPVYEIKILGYSDSSGNPHKNMKLSKLRADIVKNYFVAKRISQEKIKVFGLGPINPIASNETPEGRKKNRRVEIKLNILNKH